MCPTGDKRMGANPHVNGGRMRVPLRLPELGSHAVQVAAHGAATDSALGTLGEYLADVFRLNEQQRNFRIVCPDEVSSNRLQAVFEASGHAYEWPTDHEISPDYVPDGRIMEVLSEHNCQGWLQGYVLTGRHGIFPCYEAFIPIVDGMVNQYGKFLKMSREEAQWREPVASLNYLLTSEGWRQDHNGYSHQMPGFINSMLNRREETARVYLPPDSNTLLATMAHCLQSTRPHQPRDRVQAAASDLAVDGRCDRARAPRRERVGLGEQRRRRPRRRARRAAARSPRSSCSPPPACCEPRCPSSRSAS